MKVTYSGKMHAGGGGIGASSWRQIKPLIENDLLDKLYTTNVLDEVLTTDKLKQGKIDCHIPVPELKEENPTGYDTGDIYFDGWCSIHMKEPEILHTWVGHSLFQMNAFPKAKTIVNLFSAHPITQDRLTKGEPNYTSNSTSIMKGTKELEKCKHILVPSEFIYNSLREFKLEEKAKLIPFGVDLEKYAYSERPTDIFRVIFVGGNWSRKGLHYLLAAWYHLKLKNAELIVSGIRSEWAKVLNPNNDPSVKIGYIDDIIGAYQNSSVFCLPTVEDGCPLVTYEAMACGLPVILSENTGTAQHVYNGANGFIVKAKDVKDLADRIQYLYDNPNLVRKMGKAARKMAEAFPWSRHENEYFKWIKSL